jgi:hypothetical protein
MSQLQKKFIADNAVDETKIRLSNDADLKARNAADSADVDILKVNASDVIEFASVPQVTSDPSAANDLARKSYVDNLIDGIRWKAPVEAASTANLTLSGEQTVDGVVLTAGDRILVKDQTTDTENGIYEVAVGSWTRTSDADNSPSEEILKAAVFVIAGSVNANKGFVNTNTSAITIGVTAITFEQFSASDAFTGGDGIDITGTTISVDLLANGGLSFSSGELQVDTDGTSASLNGSGQIQAQKTEEEVITLVAQNITDQYIDLAQTASSAESISLDVIGGIRQQRGVDYTVSLSGGVGGVTRITFDGDLATAGSAELVATDILAIRYSYL